MPILEAYQQAALNGCLQALVEAAGGSFTLVLLRDGTELATNGYSRKSISTIPDASELNEDDLYTVRLVTDTLMSASGGAISWNQLELWDADGSEVVFPRFSVTGIINDGESKKVTAVFGLPDNDATIARVSALENDVDTLETELTTVEAEVDVIQNGLQTATAVQTAITNSDVARLPKGDLVPTVPFDITGGTGGTVQGFGAPNRVAQGATTKLNSIIRCTSMAKTAGQKLFNISRSDVELKSFAVAGDTAANIAAGTGTKMPVVFGVSKEDGTGSGKIKADNISVSYANIAWKFANAPLEGNCDESYFNNCWIDKCDVGIQLNSVQSLGYTWSNLRLAETAIACEVKGGGKIMFHHPFVAHPSTFLMFRNDNPDEFGTNASLYCIDDLEYDSQAVNSKVVDCESGIAYYAHLDIRRPVFCSNSPAVWTNPAFHIGQQMSLFVDKGVNLHAGMFSFNSPNNDSYIEMYCPKVWTNVTDIMDLFRLDLSTGTTRVSITRAQRYNGYTTFDQLDEVIVEGTL